MEIFCGVRINQNFYLHVIGTTIIQFQQVATIYHKDAYVPIYYAMIY